MDNYRDLEKATFIESRLVCKKGKRGICQLKSFHR